MPALTLDRDQAAIGSNQSGHAKSCSRSNHQHWRQRVSVPERISTLPLAVGSIGPVPALQPLDHQKPLNAKGGTQMTFIKVPALFVTSTTSALTGPAHAQLPSDGGVDPCQASARYWPTMRQSSGSRRMPCCGQTEGADQPRRRWRI